MTSGSQLTGSSKTVKGVIHIKDKLELVLVHMHAAIGKGGLSNVCATKNSQPIASP